LSFEEIVGTLKPKRVINGESAPHKIKGVSLDTRVLKKGEGFLALRGNKYDGHNFLKPAQSKGAHLLIVEGLSRELSDKIETTTLVVEDTARALGLLAQALRQKFSPKVLAIIGSLGKTTAKEMLSFILRKDFEFIKNKASENNHIGLPKTLLGLRENHEVCVLELGTNHFGEIEYLSSVCRPDAAVITCVDNVHLEFFKDKRGVLREKSSVFKVCPKTLPILNGDDNCLLKLKTGVRPLYFGKNRRFAVYFEFKKREKAALLFLVNSKHLLRLNSLGNFNIYNALASLSGALYLGVPLKDSVEIISNFSFPELRLQSRTVNKVKFINDAYSSNPTALIRAIESLKFIKANRIIAVLADMLELGDKSVYFHRMIAQDIYRANFSHIIFLGKFTGITAASLIKKGFGKDRIFLAKDLHAAKEYLFKIAGKGDLVFLKGSRKFGLERIIPVSKTKEPAKK